MMNMTREETLATPFGEFRDLMNCMSIENGSAKPKKKKKQWTYEEAINLN